jgi:hypothetical protein
VCGEKAKGKMLKVDVSLINRVLRIAHARNDDAIAWQITEV